MNSELWHLEGVKTILTPVTELKYPCQIISFYVTDEMSDCLKPKLGQKLQVLA